MLTFIVPLKSARVSKSWADTCCQLERTLRSLCAQTNPNFQVIVVGHEIPQLDWTHPKVEFQSVDLPIPPTLTDPKEHLRVRDRDRDAKVSYGFCQVAERIPHSYVMAVDADDWVSCRLAQLTEDEPHKPGWYIKRGYRYQFGQPWILLMRKGFDSYCGTSNIIAIDSCEFLKDCQGLSLFELSHLYRKSYHHTQVRKTFERLGKPLDPLPFAGAVYVGHDDNLLFGGGRTTSDRILTKRLSWKTRLWRAKSILDYRYFSPQLRAQFGVASVR